MKRCLSLLLLLAVLALTFVACNGDEPQGDGGVTDTTPGDTPDTTPDTTPDGGNESTPEYGDNVVDFDTIA